MSKNKKQDNQYHNFEFLPTKYIENTLFRDSLIEKNILAIMISDESRQQMGIDYLTSDDFVSEEYKQLFSLISEKKKQTGIDKITFFNFYDISNDIETSPSLRNKFPLVTSSLLSDLSISFQNENNFNFYIEKLRELTKLRALEVFYEISLNSFKNKKDISWDFSLADFEKFVTEHNGSRINNSSFVSIGQATQEFQEKLSEIKAYNSIDKDTLLTDFNSIDYYVKGFKPGQLIVLAARPGVGKTALALNIASNISRLKPYDDSYVKNVAFISLEMPVNELIARYYSSLAKIDLWKIQNPRKLDDEEWFKLQGQFIIEEENSHLFFDDATTSRITDIIWKIKQLAKNLKDGLHFVVVDYLQLISGGPNASGNRQNEIALISRSLKTLALDLKIPIMALSQLSRSVENREDKSPQLHDLRESGAIEQDADIVIFLSRNTQKKSKNNNDSKDESSEYTLTKVSVAKNRNGQPGNSELIYEGRIVTFNDAPRDISINEE
ncbi:replicative DNA helicase [Mycoplasmopsis felis]|uniref:Replicative DNA helicase n=1 Tax=Mycoplasmopsis felis TaxID=33923 RepID=A0A809S949_9BACT|nr:DnaB-like helicase C-terminal domain-containing protein [Mycoplasmopsis felis]BBU47844.1 replicative DNA helicase [Mycoplasmopsis felis]